LNGYIVCCLIIFIYAIIGVSFFKGQFFRCVFIGETEIENLRRLEEVFTKQDCLDKGGTWYLSQYNFDTVISSLSILFEIITTEGWLDVMYMSIDSVGVDM
jgi:hypothetical protein